MKVSVTALEPFRDGSTTATEFAAPPVSSKPTRLFVLPYSTVRFTSATDGGAKGTTTFEATDDAPVPAVLVAVTVNV